jgi:hypothetical protein
MTRRAKGSVAGQILGYLIDHRSAQDTLEGIAGWWIPQQRLKCELEQARRALEELVEKGFVVAQRLADGRTHYRVNPGMEQEIAEFLRHEEGREEGTPGLVQEDAGRGPGKHGKRLGNRKRASF